MTLDLFTMMEAAGQDLTKAIQSREHKPSLHDHLSAYINLNMALGKTMLEQRNQLNQLLMATSCKKGHENKDKPLHSWPCPMCAAEERDRAVADACGTLQSRLEQAQKALRHVSGAAANVSAEEMRLVADTALRALEGDKPADPVKNAVAEIAAAAGPSAGGARVHKMADGKR